MAIGKVLIRLRDEKGMSQYEVAERLGISRSRYNSWEQDIANPRTDMLNKLAEFFDVTPNLLLGSKDTSQTKLTIKEDRDIAIDLERMIGELETNEAMAFHGEPMDEETKELMRISLENSLRLAKGMAKQKFNPNKNK